MDIYSWRRESKRGFRKKNLTIKLCSGLGIIVKETAVEAVFTWPCQFFVWTAIELSCAASLLLNWFSLFSNFGYKRTKPK